MKHILSSFTLMLLLTSAYGQVNFTKVPLNKQLIGRNLSTNTGEIIIEGNVNNTEVNYQSIKVDIYRDNIPINHLSSELNYVSNIASFKFNFSITAELANYSIQIYGENAGIRTLEKEIIDIVAGDIYLIQGQSNAEAPQFNGDANVYQNDFIRVYAGGFSSPSLLLNNDKWHLGQGNGNSYFSAGNTGQWGLKLANSIVNTTNIPIAIFNGAHGGKEISFFLAPFDYVESIGSNYGRLYYRLNQTGLKDSVRAIFWSQGETDAAPLIRTTTDEYKRLFLSLKDSWSRDYPNIEHIYIFQTKNGCSLPIDNLMQIKEAQRQLAYENSEITIIPTAAMTHHSDNCHFPLANGYEMFSDRLSPLVFEDLYDVTTSLDINAPMITSASLSDETTLIIETNSITDLEITSIAENFELSSNIPTTITTIDVIDSNIILTLSNHPGFNNPTISYLAQNQGQPGNFITNANDLELICFYKYPIDVSKTLSLENISNNQNIKVFPNPTTDTIQIESVDNNQFKIYDTLGSEIINGTMRDKTISVKNLTNGLYFLKFENGITLNFIKE